MNYPGYTLVRREDCPEQHGVLTVLNHDVSGATVLLVENEDTNKAFGIGFGTFPSDDTGVFHILEHSVLAGSEKYPVTSPFLQLLKSSMASFLNAMTFPDKTVYPFATPNETDFRNLMDVYLNAVFSPLAMVDRDVYEHEGWHPDEDGTVSVGTQSLVPWETDYGKLEIMADVYLNYLAQVFNLPDDDYVKTKLEFGSDSADRDSLMTAEEKEIISANE